MAGHETRSAIDLAVPDADSSFTSEKQRDESQRADSGPANHGNEQDTTPSKPARGLRFWAIIASLAVTAILSALEGTIVSTALPTIVEALGGGELYLWVVNGYFLPSTAVQPLFAQLADIFGRRNPIIVAVSLFILGSGIGGGATSIHMLIGSRVVQGIGGGGILVLVNLIVSDLVPVRERGAFFAIIYGATTVANGLGPFISGVIVYNTTWRWVFYLNLPIGGFALALLILCLKVTSDRAPARQKLGRIDFFGHFLFVGSVVAILIALTYAGTVHPWGSWQTILPLVLGFLGLLVYLAFEASGIPAEPAMPLRIFANRTSGAIFALGFLHSLLTVWIIYFLPVYFQAVKGSNPQDAGLHLLPTILVLMPFAIIGGKLLQYFGKYRWLHALGFAVMTAGFGCFTLLDASSSTAEWGLVQCLEAAGAGLVVSSMLPAVQAPLSEADTAAVTGAFSFIRSFGISFAVTVPGTLFNNKFDHLAHRISEPQLRAQFTNGLAYEHGTKDFIGKFTGQTHDEIIGVYTDSLKFVWQVAIGICGFTFLLVFLEKHYELRDTLDSKFGVKEKTTQKQSEKSRNLEAVQTNGQ